YGLTTFSYGDKGVFGLGPSLHGWQTGVMRSSCWMRSHFTECGDGRLDVFKHYGHRLDVTGCDPSRSPECHGPDHDAVLHQHPLAAGDWAQWRRAQWRWA